MGSNLIKDVKKMNERFKNAFKMYIFWTENFWTFGTKIFRVENFSEISGRKFLAFLGRKFLGFLGRKLFKVFDPQVQKFFNHRVREFSDPKSPKNFRPK